MTEPDTLKGIKAIADFLDVSERTALRRCRSRMIPAYKEGGWRMSKSVYLERLAELQGRKRYTAVRLTG
jgi:hypothetical protein